jgi:hypothetical protein
MTTIIDPHGTPEPVYTRSGTTIQTIAGNGTTLGAATPIIGLSGYSVVIVEATSSPANQAVVLPDDAQIGDVVEVYSATGGAAAIVFPPTGETIGQPASLTLQPGGTGILLRKIAATAWRFVFKTD